MEIEKEKEKVFQFGLVMDTYIDQTLRILEKLNPVNNLLPLLTTKEKGGPPLVETHDPRVKGIIDSWLNMFNDVLKTGKDLPVDLISRAAEIAREMKEKKNS